MFSGTEPFDRPGRALCYVSYLCWYFDLFYRLLSDLKSGCI